MASDRRKSKDASHTAERRASSRRAFPRMPVSLWATEDDGKGIYYHHVSDLSSGGLFLEKGLLLPVGSRMQLELTLPTARSIRAEGIVVTKVENSKKQNGNGIRFDKISDQ
ncbi:MAG TPA: PilZ domain-containing protein, partial [bacterium]|nr:PilZ domain-containing protein [bacterium]